MVFSELWVESPELYTKTKQNKANPSLNRRGFKQIKDLKLKSENCKIQMKIGTKSP
jgi:hypothetical protein